MDGKYQHIDEFLSGLSAEELNYIADRAEVLMQEANNTDSETSVQMNDFEEAMME